MIQMTGKILPSKKKKNAGTSIILENENVKTFLYNFQKQLVIVPTDKTANNFYL